MRARLIGFLLIALLALPATWAAHGASAEMQGTEHCAGHDNHANEDCTCCPEGTSASGCLYSCLIAFAIPAALVSVPEEVIVHGPPVHAAARFSTRADSPFKPPPIL